MNFGMSLAFDRQFVLFSYSVSHGLLLFRSGKSAIHRTRVDVLFQDVRALECRSVLDGLAIDQVSPEFLAEVRSRAVDVMEPGLNVYSLKSKGWIGFVVGGIVSHQEDEGEFFEMSTLLGGQ